MFGSVQSQEKQQLHKYELNPKKLLYVSLHWCFNYLPLYYPISLLILTCQCHVMLQFPTSPHIFDLTVYVN